MSADAILAADSEQRRRALDIGASFIVQAPAGSGKTELLVRRFLALLAVVDRPEAVLAITFTRKAAGEMRERILRALRQAASASPPPVGDYERERYDLAAAVLARSDAKNWHLLGSPSRLQVFTIDGLCSRIATGLPLLSRLGSSPGVVEDVTPHLTEAVTRALTASGLGGGTEHLGVLLERYEMGVKPLAEQLVAMLRCRDQWSSDALAARDSPDGWVAEIEAAFARAVRAELAAMTSEVPASLASRIYDVAARTRAALPADSCPWPTLGLTSMLLGEAACVQAWREACFLLCTGGGTLRKPGGLNVKVGAGDKSVKADYVALLEEVAALPSPHDERFVESLLLAARLPARAEFAGEGRLALKAFLDVLLHAHVELWNVFRERREVDYTEIAVRATAALAQGEALEKLDSRIEHILVDEFQDTSVLQCRLLGGLMSGWTPDGGRTLFLVGDPMQSIYRFRKAEVGLFLSAREGRLLDAVELEALTLAVNFRSESRILDWVNTVFAGLLGDRDDVERSLVAYARAQPRPGAGDGEATRVLLWEAEATADADSPAATKSARTAADDEAEASGLALLIRDELLPAARQRGGRVALLVRARTHALPILQALARAGVRARAPGLDHLGDRPVVRDLESLARAILHPGDRLAQLSVLRGPLVGLALAELSALVEPGITASAGRPAYPPIASLLRDPSALAALGDDSRRRVARWQQVQASARLALGARPFDVVVRSAWLRLGGPALVDAAGALDAEVFFGLLSSVSSQGRVDLDLLAAALSTEKANVDPDPAIDVDVLTMHTAKGLEWDTVILPGLTRGPGGGDDLPMAMETEPANGELRMVAPRQARGREDADKDKHAFLTYREKRRETQETLRLLYVATTRARRCLLLSGSRARLNKDGGGAARTLYAALRPGLSDADVEICSVALQEVGAPPSRVRSAVDFAPCRPAPLSARIVTSEKPSESADVLPEFLAQTKRPAHVGTVVHAFVERVAKDGLQAWSVDRLAGEKGWLEHQLRRQGVLRDEIAESMAEVVEAASVLLSDDRARWALSSHVDARSEWKLLALEGSVLTRAAIDRTFLDGEDRWIIDFKTGRPDLGSGPYRGLDAKRAAQAYIASHRDGYARQLRRYRDLLEHEGSRFGFVAARRIRLGLFFAHLPAGQRWVELGD